jgi:hypothetical protein
VATFHKHKTEAGNDPSGLKARVHKVTSEIAGEVSLVCVDAGSVCVAALTRVCRW